MKLFPFLFRHQWLIAAIIFVVAGFFLPTLDIAVHDTYVVISGAHAGIGLGLLFIIMWLLRLIPVFRMSRILSGIHLAGNSVAGMLLLIGLFRSGIHEAPRRYSDYSVYDEFDSGTSTMFDTNMWITVLLLVFILLQLIWIIQPVLFLVKKIANRKDN